MTLSKVLADLATFINSVGVPVAMLCFGCFVIWHAGKWFGGKLLVPVVETVQEVGSAHIKYLQANTLATETAAAGVSEVLANQHKTYPKIDDIHDRLIVRPYGMSQQHVSEGS